MLLISSGTIVEMPRPDVGVAQAASDPLAPIRRLLLDAVASPITRAAYARALDGFAQWRAGQPFTRASVQAYRSHLEAQGLAPSSVNQKLAALKKLAKEAAANGLLASEAAAGIAQVPGAKESGTRSGNWLTQQQAQDLLHAPDGTTLKGQRDRAALALLVGCGLRRGEAVALTVVHMQQREGRWVIVDLRGKHGRIRTVPVPAWVKHAVDVWCAYAGITEGHILRGIDRHGRISESLSGEAIRLLTAEYGTDALRPHDLRRTCAKLCRKAGGELEQIQLLLGHASVQTTERYLGTRQDLAEAPNDRLGLKWREEKP